MHKSFNKTAQKHGKCAINRLPMLKIELKHTIKTLHIRYLSQQYTINYNANFDRVWWVTPLTQIVTRLKIKS